MTTRSSTSALDRDCNTIRYEGNTTALDQDSNTIQYEGNYDALNEEEDAIGSKYIQNSARGSHNAILEEVDNCRLQPYHIEESRSDDFKCVNCESDARPSVHHEEDLIDFYSQCVDKLSQGSFDAAQEDNSHELESSFEEFDSDDFEHL